MALIAANAYTVKPKLMRSGHSWERRNARSGGRRLSRLMRHLSLGCGGSNDACDKAMQELRSDGSTRSVSRLSGSKISAFSG